MKVHYDIKQGSEQWHEIRYGKIGGTLSKGLLVKSDTLLIDIVSQLCEEFEMEFDSYINADMQRGNDLETLGRKELSKYTKINFLEAGWIQSDNEILGISPDGISEDETVTCEIKCPDKKKHTKTLLLDAIPLDNIHQCIHYFTVNPKLTTHYFCSFRPESIKPLFVKKLTRDSEVNIGTVAKPVITTVQGCVNICLKEAELLALQIKESVDNLTNVTLK